VGGKVGAQRACRQGGTIRSAVRTRGQHGLRHRDMVQTMNVQRGVVTPVIVAAVWGTATRAAPPSQRPCVYKEGGLRSQLHAAGALATAERTRIARLCLIATAAAMKPRLLPEPPPQTDQLQPWCPPLRSILAARSRDCGTHP